MCGPVRDVEGAERLDLGDSVSDRLARSCWRLERPLDADRAGPRTRGATCSWSRSSTTIDRDPVDAHDRRPALDQPIVAVAVPERWRPPSPPARPNRLRSHCSYGSRRGPPGCPAAICDGRIRASGRSVTATCTRAASRSCHDPADHLGLGVGEELAAEDDPRLARAAGPRGRRPSSGGIGGGASSSATSRAQADDRSCRRLVVARAPGIQDALLAHLGACDPHRRLEDVVPVFDGPMWTSRVPGGSGASRSPVGHHVLRSCHAGPR